jgi:hypothetical protein
MAGRHVAITAAAVLAVPLGLAAADDSFRHARVRLVEPGVSLQSASEPGAEEASVNMPFLPGDRVWTDNRGRVEFHFADGSLLRVDQRTKLDYDGYDGERGGKVILRLWSGSVYVHQRDHTRSPEFVIETPAAAATMHERGDYRVDVAAGETRLSVFEGEAFLEADDRVRVRDGQRAFARRGERASGADRFDRNEGDDFARWDAELGDEAYASRSEYLPEEVSPFAEDFERNGSWYFEAGVGNVWRPHVGIGWRPYTNGRWAWTAYGWTWVPNEPWGWAPSHYGRWDHSQTLGWYWIPGRTWGPAWVSWSVSNDHVGWCPLGYRDRPVVIHERGRAVPRGGAGASPWTYVRRADLGSRDIARRRVEASAVPVQSMRALEAGSARVTRDGTVAEGHAVPRNIRTKPGPGDTVPELRTDNMTTIPFPVARTRYESERERERERQQNPDNANPTLSPRGRSKPADPNIRPDTAAAPEVTGWSRGRARTRTDSSEEARPAATSPDGARRRPETTRTEEGDREALRPWFGRFKDKSDENRTARPAREDQTAPRERSRQESEPPRTVQPREIRSEPRAIRSEPKPRERERANPPPPQNDGARERGAVRREKNRDRDH